MEYDVSHIHGNGDWCDSGLKVRCVSPEAPPLNPPTAANELMVATYNVYERAWFISLDGQRERTCRIPHVIARDYPHIEVITVQEMFMDGCFEGLSEMFSINASCWLWKLSIL